MQDKPLTQTEHDVLEVLCQLDATSGAVDRTRLSVAVRGRGLEFGRALGRLITLGLAEEITRRPFFLWRLFGAKPQVRLQPTAKGLTEKVGPVKGEAADPEPAQLAPEQPAPPTVLTPEPTKPGRKLRK